MELDGIVQAVLLLFRYRPRHRRRIVRMLLAAPLVVFLWHELAGRFLDWPSVLFVSLLLAFLFGFLLMCATAVAAADLANQEETPIYAALHSRRLPSNSQGRRYHTTQASAVTGGSDPQSNHEVLVSAAAFNEEHRQPEGLFPLKG